MQVTTEAALRYPLTFAPYRIRNVELRNRVVRTSMGSGLPAGGLVNDALIEFHVARARGGVALTYIDPAQTHWSSPSFLDNTRPEVVRRPAPAHDTGARRGRAGLPAADARRPHQHPAGRLGPVGGLGAARPRSRHDVPPDDAVDDRRGCRGLRDRGAACPARRRRRRRGARRPRLRVQQLPLPGHESPHRRLRRPVREPDPAAVGGARGRPRGGRAGLPARRPAVRRRGSAPDLRRGRRAGRRHP